MALGGYIKLHRKLLDWGWYTDLNVRVVFLHLLLKASFKDSVWRGVPVGRGQLVTSRAHLAAETGLSERQIRTALNKLKTTGEVTVKATKQYTLLTVSNYAFYQGSGADSDQPSDQRSDQPSTNERPHRKNVKKIKEYTYAHFDTFWSAYPRKVSKRKAGASFLKIKPDEELLAKMLGALEVQKNAWSDPQYIPHPATWLNQRRWEDEAPTAIEAATDSYQTF